MAVSVPFTGGCACGAIRYECSAEPMMSWKCHCRDCQRATGSAFVAGMIVPATAFTFTKGEPKYYGMKSTSGSTIYRSFCPRCGAGIGGKSDGFPDIMGVRAASMDDPSGFEPLADIWTRSAQPWDYLHPESPKYEQALPEEDIPKLLVARK